MVVSDNEPSTKRRRCLLGEERKLADPTTTAAPLSSFPEAEVVPAKQQQPTMTTPAAAVVPTNKVCTVFIGGLHPRIMEAHIEKMCMPYGQIQRLHLCDRKGYAFCQYSSPAQASAAMQALDGRGLLGRRLLVRPAHSDQQQQQQQSSQQQQHNTNKASGTGSSNPDKERERIEARIQAVKRKLHLAPSR